MTNCDMCGRYLYHIIDVLKPTDEVECETGIRTVDGIICGCCMKRYIANKKLIDDLKDIGVI